MWFMAFFWKKEGLDLQFLMDQLNLNRQVCLPVTNVYVTKIAMTTKVHQ